ncbi:MAG: COG1361 S-layer family protein [Haloferacaceae archaeon]
MVPEPEQSFAVDDLSSNLRVGDDGTLEGRVTNTGDLDVRNAVVVFETDKPNVTPIETESPVGDLAAGESASFSFPVEISESAEAGPQQYSLSVRYRDQDDDRRTSDAIDVRQEVGPDADKFSLETNGATVEPGAGTVLEVTITNEADERLTDISANMFADSPISVEDEESFVGALDPGESETVSFSIGATDGALAKNYPVSLDFQYDEPDGDTELSDTYRLAVSVEPAEDGGPPLLVIGALLVLVVVAGAYLYRRYG